MSGTKYAVGSANIKEKAPFLARKYVLPFPLVRRIRVFPGQRVRQLDASISSLHRPLVLRFDVHEVLLQRFHQGFWQQRHTVLVPLTSGKPRPRIFPFLPDAACRGTG